MQRLVQTIIVEWAHCDAAGIVFYPYFFTWFDQATERLFTANDLSYPELNARGIFGMPLLETGAHYDNPCRLGDRLAMNTWVDDWQRKTLLVKHRLQHADGRPALEGFERRAWVVTAPESPRGMTAAEIPPDIIARFDTLSCRGRCRLGDSAEARHLGRHGDARPADPGSVRPARSVRGVDGGHQDADDQPGVRPAQDPG